MNRSDPTKKKNPRRVSPSRFAFTTVTFRDKEKLCVFQAYISRIFRFRAIRRTMTFNVAEIGIGTFRQGAQKKINTRLKYIQINPSLFYVKYIIL